MTCHEKDRTLLDSGTEPLWKEQDVAAERNWTLFRNDLALFRILLESWSCPLHLLFLIHIALTVIPFIL
jgi:hypothetical protein